jgi:hypothetical protein
MALLFPVFITRCIAKPKNRLDTVKNNYPKLENFKRQLIMNTNAM